MTNRQDWYVCELSQAGIASRPIPRTVFQSREDLLYAFDSHDSWKLHRQA